MAKSKSEAALPVVRSMGIRRQPDGGWVVYLIHSQGEMITNTEILGDGPASRSVAQQLFKMEMIRRFLLDDPDGPKA